MNLDMPTLQLLAGSLSSLMFISATFPMLYKAWRTRDLRSYSLIQLSMNNLANVIHWFYITSLPFGPAWWVHGFNTLATLLMLVWYLAFRSAPVIKRATTTIARLTGEMVGIRTTGEIPAA